MPKESYIDSRKKKSLLDGSLETENQILKNYLKEKLRISEKQIKQIIEERREIFLPVSIFRNKLSTLEIIVKYLNEVKKLSFVEISRLLNRDDRTVWHAYRRAVKKKIGIKVLDSEIKIPVSIFSNRKYSALELLVAHLKDSHKLKFTEIAALLDCSPKTVWTVYQRVKKKNASKK